MHARPFPYLGHGVAAARKTMHVFVAFRDEVPEDARAAVQAGAPEPLAGYFDWSGRTLTFGHDADSLQWVVAAIYPGAGPRAEHGETTTAQWEALRTELDDWLLRVHRERPIDLVIQPIDDEYSTSTSAWHDATVRTAPGELWHRCAALGKAHGEWLAIAVGMWRDHVYTTPLADQQRVIAELDAAARATLERHGGVPEPTAPETPAADPDLDRARAAWRVAPTPLSFAREIGHPGYDLWQFACALNGAGAYAEVEAIVERVIVESPSELQFPGHWWSLWAEVLIAQDKLDAAIDPLRGALVRATSYSSSPWEELVTYYERRHDNERAAIAWHGARKFVTGFRLSRKYPAPANMWQRFTALLLEWLEPAYQPAAMTVGEVRGLAFMSEKIGGALTELGATVRAEQLRRQAPYTAFLEAARARVPAEQVLALASAAGTDPEYTIYWVYAGSAMEQRGDHATAIELFEEGLRRAGDLNGYVWVRLLGSLRVLGMIERAAALLPQALPHAAKEPEIYRHAACIRLQRGDRSGAVATCRAAVEHGYPAAKLRDDEELASLRDEPEFVTLCARSANETKAKPRARAKAKAKPGAKAKAKAKPGSSAKAQAKPKAQPQPKATRKARAQPQAKAAAKPAAKPGPAAKAKQAAGSKGRPQPASSSKSRPRSPPKPR